MGVRTLAALALAAGLLGCGVETKTIGDACSDPNECPGGPAGAGFCSFTLPMGYCTRTCRIDGDCDARSFCAVNAGSLICFRRCATNADCRVTDGYACTGVASDGVRKYCYIH